MEVLRVYSELTVSAKLAEQLDGRTEVETPAGRIDVLTDSHIIEVKRLEGWKGGLGQLTAYAVYYPHHLQRLHLLVEAIEKNKEFKLEAVRTVCEKVGVELTYDIVSYTKQKPVKPRIESKGGSGTAWWHSLDEEDEDLVYYVAVRKRLGKHTVIPKLYKYYQIEFRPQLYWASIEEVLMVILALDELEKLLTIIGELPLKQALAALAESEPNVLRQVQNIKQVLNC